MGNSTRPDDWEWPRHELIRWEIGLTAPATRAFPLVGGLTIGGPGVIIMAGPCSVESEDQILAAARAVKSAGAAVLRGGAFKPRTTPHSFQGLGADGLRLLRQAGDAVGLPVVTEVMAHTDVDLVARHAQILQIGARSMQNYPLLHAIGETKLPVILKRGLAATVEEWLGAVEHIRARGNERIILCERGIRAVETATRFTLDINAVPLMHRLCDLPIIVDPSHATGRADLVPEVSRAALAAGADGLLVEVHPQPALALSDGQQSLATDQFADLVPSLRRVANAIGRNIS
ncbi:MAG: 3-deoxy-7-phosphoheptulonate synthase [Chloroflexi bacterium]|nr:3-deoxy-7-phosphoheptulonate synthase [Chloroflexota bacterium]